MYKYSSSASVLLVILRAVDYVRRARSVLSRRGGEVSGEGVVPMSTDNASLSPPPALPNAQVAGQANGQ